MSVVDLFGETEWFYVDCVDPNGNAWCHKTSDPEGTIAIVAEALPDVACSVRRARSAK